MSTPVLAVNAAPNPATGHLHALVHAGYSIIEADDLGAALDMARRTLPRMVLVDASTAREAPLHLVLHLRGDEATRHIPVLVLRAGRALAGEDVLCGLGGVSCLPHPFQLRWLLQEVQYLTTRAPAGRRLPRTRRRGMHETAGVDTTAREGAALLVRPSMLPVEMRRRLPVPAEGLGAMA